MREREEKITWLSDANLSRMRGLWGLGVLVLAGLGLTGWTNPAPRPALAAADTRCIEADQSLRQKLRAEIESREWTRSAGQRGQPDRFILAINDFSEARRFCRMGDVVAGLGYYWSAEGRLAGLAAVRRNRS